MTSERVELEVQHCGPGTGKSRLVDKSTGFVVGVIFDNPKLAERLAAADAWPPGEGLPEKSQKVLAWLEGFEDHTGRTWTRCGFAFMYRHPGLQSSVKDGWARGPYEEALKAIGADALEVKRWWPLPPEGEGEGL